MGPEAPVTGPAGPPPPLWVPNSAFSRGLSGPDRRLQQFPGLLSGWKTQADRRTQPNYFLSQELRAVRALPGLKLKPGSLEPMARRSRPGCSGRTPGRRWQSSGRGSPKFPRPMGEVCGSSGVSGHGPGEMSIEVDLKGRQARKEPSQKPAHRAAAARHSTRKDRASPAACSTRAQRSARGVPPLAPPSGN